MAQRIQRDHEADGWERSDYPITCASCLGDNPYLRMTIANYGKECKECTRPFTVFRWRPGRNARYKKTEICQTCSKLKNVRDTALNITTHDSIPRSHVNREYFAEEHDRMTRAGLDYDSSIGKMRPNDTILKLQRTEPHYERNRPQVRTYYTSGRCIRGEECAYRHEMPKTGDLSHQNIKDRYYGENDPVAMKLLGKACEMGSLDPLEDVAHSGLLAGPVVSQQHYYTHPTPPNQDNSYYPSMDPQRIGSSTSENNGASSSSYLMPPHQQQYFL